MDYDLFRLNPRTFEHLIQALGTKVLGQGLMAFGDGPDGGREAAINARVPFPTSSAEWDGQIVIQAKFRQRTEGRTKDGQWAVEQLRNELAAYEKPGTQRQLPDYMIYATNVTLSAGAGGAKDRLLKIGENFSVSKSVDTLQSSPKGPNTFIRKPQLVQAPQESLRGFHVWDYDQLRLYLDQYEDVRRSFSAYILSGDVLADMAEKLQRLPGFEPDFDESMATFLQKELLADQYAKLEQGGSVTADRVPVSQVFVDLPAFAERRGDPPTESEEGALAGFISEILDASSHYLGPSFGGDGSTPVGEDDDSPPDGRVVLIGGPGQGKTTLGQFACQLFRAALLKPRSEVSPEVKTVLKRLEKDCEGDGISLPSTRRFPLRLPLNAFADELAKPTGASSLLEYVARRISDRIPGEISTQLMAEWLGEYPWLLVLDGLDEVPVSSNRAQVLDAITEFWVDASVATGDCLVIATTRPQGFNDDFSPLLYRHRWLAPLSPRMATRYGERLIDARHGNDLDRRELIASRLAEATSNKDSARLLTSPLQVTIMTTLLGRGGRVPPGRWDLFHNYYDAIYKREVEREIPAAEILRQYKPDIDAIHSRVGLVLQTDAEREESTEPQMTRERFEEIVVTRLEEEHHDPEARAELVPQIIDAATNRLVFLVGRQADHVGFEVPSLREFMAAEAILEDEQVNVEARLRDIAPLSAWRNVFLFAAGRCFSDLQYLRGAIHAICIELDSPMKQLAGAAMPGSVLAVDLLADGIALRQPRYLGLLAASALRLLRRPPSVLNDRLAEVYDPDARATYERELKAYLGRMPFVESLGAWRTAAVLGARSEDWCFDLLEQHLPDPDELGDLLQMLPPSAASLRLGETLAVLCAAAPPDQSLPFRESLRALGALSVMPAWLRVVIEGSSPASRMAVAIPGHDSTIEAQLLPVGGGRTVQRGALGLEARAEAQPSWHPLLAALDFTSAPSAKSLADAIESLSADLEYGKRWLDYMPWPLASLVLAAAEEEGGGNVVRMARVGSFGGLTQWRDAQSRWSQGVFPGDLAYPPGGALPFDAVIGFKGFPLSVAVLSGHGPPAAAIDQITSWLRRMRHPPARRQVVEWLFGIIESGHGEISAIELLEVLEEHDLSALRILPLATLNAIAWSDPLNEDEIELLDIIGKGFQRIPVGLPDLAPEPALRRRLVRAFTETPKRFGLFRILAVSWPQEGEHRAEGRRLLAAAPDRALADARAVLALRTGDLGKDPDASLRNLIEGDEMWLDAALHALETFAIRNEDVNEALIAGLERLIPGSRWDDRDRVSSLADLLIARRSSGLSSAASRSSARGRAAG